MRRSVGWVVLSFALVGTLGGCQTTIPKEALMLNAESLQRRDLQTRRFDTRDEAGLLRAATQLVQDLGFLIDASQSKLGLVVASKERDATDGGQIAGAVIMAALFGVSTPVDRDQRIRVSIVTHPSGSQTALRVTFQRVVWNNYGQVSRLEFLDDPQMYQEFFSKLSKAVFLEAHKI